MVHRLTLVGAILTAAAAVLCACGGGDGRQAPIPNPGQVTTVMLPSGGGAIFPAGAFTTTTQVDIDDSLTGSQLDPASFPADSGSMLGSTTVKVPAGVVLNADIEVRIAVSPAQPVNRVFTIFEYNGATKMWETTAAAARWALASRQGQPPRPYIGVTLVTDVTGLCNRREL